MNSKFFTLLLAATTLSACSSTTMAPSYERPVAPIAPQFSLDSATATTTARASEIGWRSMFSSPSLQKLIGEGLANNRDLRVATLNIDAARSLYRIQRADLLPSVNATGGVTRQRLPESSSPTGKADTTTGYSASVGVTAYELDLFGRVRSLNEQALNQYFATEEARNAAQVSLIAEIANAYLTYLADQELLQLTQVTLKAHEDSYSVIKRSFDMGVGTELDVSQAQTLVETARANLAQYTRFTEQDKNALTLLVGKDIDPALLKGETLNTLALKELPAGLPSSVLLDRPDIRQAEFTLKGENANIGAARAAFFPTISLTGSAGFASDNLSGLFSSGGAAWAFTPQISVPIFQGGRLAANLDLATTERDIAVAQYEKSIQSAFREVSDALAARATYSQQLNAQQALIAANAKALTVSKARYDQGIDSHLVLLDAQRSLYTAQQNEVLVRQQRLANFVTLYKALGGGQS